MGKVIKKSIKALLISVVILLSIPTTIWFVVQDSRVQTWLITQTTTILENKLGTKVHISKFDYRPFNRVLLRDVLIEDLKGDTLIAADVISASLLKFSASSRSMTIHRAILTNAHINFATDSLGVMNLTEFLNVFIEKPEEPSEKPFEIVINNARIVESEFRLHSHNPAQSEGINFNDLHLSNLNIDARNLSIAGDTITMLIRDMSFSDKSGLVVDEFRSSLSLGSKHMDFERLRVQAMDSRIGIPHLRMSYNHWDSMSDFLKRVSLQGQIDESRVSTHFLSFFVPDLRSFNEVVNISANFHGTISDLRIRRLELFVKESTYLSANATLTGLPDINSTFLFVDINQLNTTVEDIESIQDISTGESVVDLPDHFTSLKEIGYNGNFTGFLTDFVAYGTFTSAIGDLSVDLSFKPDEKSVSSFNGNISTKGLELNHLVGTDLVGITSFKATVKGSTDYSTYLEANTDASIFTLDANNYRYRNIDVSGNLSNRTFVGSLFLDDPNAKLNFMGKVDFADTIPVFDFSAFVPKLDLVELNFNSSDSISQASFLLTAKISGSNLDNSKGEIKLVNGMYRNQNGEIKTSDITINADNTVDSKLISFKSEFAEGELRGKYNYANIFNSFQQLIYLYIPALSPDNKKPELMPTGVENPEYNDYIIRLRVRNSRKLTDVLAPNFRIAENTNVFGIYNPDFQTLTLKVMIPELVLGGNVFRNISIDGQTHDTTFVASITTPYVEVGGMFVRNIAVNATAQDNNLSTSLNWDNRTSIRNEGEISANTTFKHENGYSKMDFQFIQSQFFLNDTIWNLSPSTITIDSSAVEINNFMLHNNQQRLLINGSIANLPNDSIRLDLENLDLSNFNLYTRTLGYTLKGDIDGYAMITDITQNPLFYGDLEINDFELNNQPVGNMNFTSQWHADQRKLNLNLINTLEGRPTFQLVGDLFPESQEIDFNLNITQIPLKLLEPLLDGEVQNVNGAIAGDVRITGIHSKPNFNGLVQIVDGAGTIDFTRTHYTMSDPISIENSNLIFRNFRVFDVNNRMAAVNGTIRTNYFKDIRLDLNLTPNNFQFLNTTERDNELFYGTVFATGQARISGRPNDLSVNVSVRTEPRTALFLPLTSSRDVVEYDFVTFINRSDEIIIIEDFLGSEQVQKANFALTLDMQVTPEAEVQIIIDKQLGDIIRANGSGNLKMEIDPGNNVFDMFGEYVIERGDYLFTLQGVINKRFRIGEGSTITWNGEVEDAIMDINAIYSLRTTLGPLNPVSEDEIYSRRTQVDCHINLEGKLMEPNIKFDIKVPAAETNPEMQAVIQDALNTEERISMQFLSLLVINNFIDPDDQMGSGFGQGLASTASEMLSNQLSNWLSQWSSSFDIGVNYRPGDEISSQEIELALSTQLFNDRVTINSNVDMASQNPNAAPIAGDFSVDVKIVPSGKLRVKAFARSNDDILYGTYQHDYTTGAGVMYREDFNSVNELWSRYRNYFKRRSQRNQKQQNYQDFENQSVILPDTTMLPKKALVFVK